MGISTHRVCRLAGIAAALCLAAAGGCASLAPGPEAYDYFAPAPQDDPWSRKISRWQHRERTDRGEDLQRSPAAVAGSGRESGEEASPPADLNAKFSAFRAQQKREIARGIADWVQGQAKEHYVPDGPIDRWATLAETLRQNGDDCDGLELMAFKLLRELGFGEQVFRAVVYRRDDGQHHMVTLWFEDPEDPWVIDPTGAMTEGMPRMSEVPGWVPLKVFSEDREFSVARRHLARAEP